MRKTVLSALAAATILAGAMFADRAAAMPPAMASVMASTPEATANAALVREAGIVCGGNGCAPAQTGAVRRRKFQPLGHG
jgi:hypothetical protein